MSEENKIEIIQEQINNGISVIDKINTYYKQFCKNERKTIGETTVSAIIIAEVITNFYTCAETIFLRISRLFENNLEKEKWHRDLLDKMTLSIKGIRQNVIRDSTYKILVEIMKFRHFRRYYFEFDYDPDKMEYIEKKYKQVLPLLKKDLEDFYAFLDKIKT